jgi:hypothetical protein
MDRPGFGRLVARHLIKVYFYRIQSGENQKSLFCDFADCTWAIQALLFAVYALQDGGIQAFEGEPATVQ